MAFADAVAQGSPLNGTLQNDSSLRWGLWLQAVRYRRGKIPWMVVIRLPLGYKRCPSNDLEISRVPLCSAQWRRPGCSLASLVLLRSLPMVDVAPKTLINKVNPLCLK